MIRRPRLRTEDVRDCTWQRDGNDWSYINMAQDHVARVTSDGRGRGYRVIVDGSVRKRRVHDITAAKTLAEALCAIPHPKDDDVSV